MKKPHSLSGKFDLEEDNRIIAAVLEVTGIPGIFYILYHLFDTSV